MRTVIVYYSYGGNTRKVARQIQKETKVDMVKLEPLNPYDGDYWDVVDQGKIEVEQDVKPKLKTNLNFIKNYERIILCSPIWWYTLAPVVKSFLDNVDISSKEVIPVITNGGYGVGKSIQDLKKLAPEARIKDYLEIVFDENIMRVASKDEIQTFLKTMEV